MIYTIRTASGREDIVVDLLEAKIKSENLDVKAVFHPAEIKGYVFIEGTEGNVQKAIRGIMNVRGLINKPINIEDIRHFLQYEKARITLNVGDVVEIISGPFKGERGKIQRIDPVKDEVTIELLEASIPIPVTITSEFVKILKSAEKKEESSQ